METFGKVLETTRIKKRISLKKASLKLLIKQEHLAALEKEDWPNLPETTFVKGYIISYSKFLDLDADKMLALFRREFDEKKIPKAEDQKNNPRNLLVTPKRVRSAIFALAIFGFIVYITIQYSRILSAPDLEIFQPPDDVTVSVPIIEISGKVENQSQVSIDGEFVPADQDDNFSYFYNLAEGKNIIEIIASKRLSPKTKITRTIRLIH